MLQLASLFERPFQPQPRSVRQQMFGESENTLNVDGIDASVIELQLGDRDFLPQPIPLPVVRPLVDRLFVNEGVVKAIETRTKFIPSSGGRVYQFFGRIPLHPPHVEHDFAEQTHIGGIGLQRFEMVDEHAFDRFPPRANPRALWTVVIAVPLLATRRKAARQRTSAFGTRQETPEREIRAVPSIGPHLWRLAFQASLDALERGCINDRYEIARAVDFPFRNHHAPGIHRIPKNHAERLDAQRRSMRAAESSRVQTAENIIRATAFRDQSKSKLDQTRTAFVGNQAWAAAVGGMLVTDWCLEGPASKFQCGTHTAGRPFGLLVVVELGDRGEHPLHELTGRRVVDWLCDRPQRDSKVQERRSEKRVIVVLPGESGDVVNDDCLDPPFVATTILKETLKFRTISGFCRLSFLDKRFRDDIAVSNAVVRTCFALRRQAEILSLLFRRDAAVDNSVRSH